MTQKDLKTLAVIIFTFIVYYFNDAFYFNELRAWIFKSIGIIGISHIISYTISLVPLMLGLLVLHKRLIQILKSVGFHRSILRAIIFCLLATSPILIGNVIFGTWNPTLDIDNLLISVVAAAFFEEIIYRGFLFGQLFQKTRLAFFPSIFLGSVIFGLLHLYQSEDLLNAFYIFGITFLGSLLFGWAYAEWNFNIWIPIFLHLFMNLFFELFVSGETALTTSLFNILRLLSVVLIVLFTIGYKRKKRIPLTIHRKNLWWKQKDN